MPGRLENLITVSGQIIFDFQRTKIFCLFYHRIVSVIQVALWQSNCLAGGANIISNRLKPQASNLASPCPSLGPAELRRWKNCRGQVREPHHPLVGGERRDLLPVRIIEAGRRRLLSRLCSLSGSKRRWHRWTRATA